MKENSIFTSERERKLWLSAFVIMVAIYSTLFFGGRLIDFMVESRIIEQSTFYLFLILVATFLLSGWKSTKKRVEYWIYAGVITVYGMALLRMNLSVAERSHMFEYGLLSILIYEAIKERKLNGANIKYPLISAILIVGTVGLLDECIQYFIPFRVFDIVDIGFNYLASAIGVLMSLGVSKLQQFFTDVKS